MNGTDGGVGKVHAHEDPARHSDHASHGRCAPRQNIFRGYTPKIGNGAHIEVGNFGKQPPAEVEAPDNALIDDDGDGLAPDLSQDANLGAQVKPSLSVLDDAACLIVISEQRAVEELADPLSKSKLIAIGVLEERQRGDLLHERNKRAGNARTTSERPTRTRHVTHHVEEPPNDAIDDLLLEVLPDVLPVRLRNGRHKERTRSIGAYRQTRELSEY